MSPLGFHAPRVRLSLAIAASLLLPAGHVVAGDLDGVAHVVNPGDAVEAWTLVNGATLTIAPGASSLGIVSTNSTLIIDPSAGGLQGEVNATGIAVRLLGGSTATLTDARIVSTGNRGLEIVGGSTTAMPVNATVNRGSIVGSTYGFAVGNFSSLALHGTTVEGTSATNGIGGVVFNGDVTIDQGSTVTGQTYGMRIRTDNRGGNPNLPSARTLLIDASRVEGLTQSGIVFDALRPLPDMPNSDGTVSIVNGSEVIGGNGVAIEADGSVAPTAGDVTVDASTIRGDVRAGTNATLTFRLLNGSAMTGAMSGAVTAAVGSGATWNVSGDSDVDSLDLSGGTAAFVAPTAGSYHTVTVRGDLTGSGGSFGFNTEMNAGGALSAQATDRLLVEGNVTTTGPTEIVVTPSGAGALTDINQNGAVDANEGISLVQVVGSSRADAFVLRGGYVAAGPWQYTLHAFGPGQVDPAQNALASGTLNWDYRLGNLYVCQTGCDPVDPETPPVDPGEPGDPGNPVDPVDPVIPPGGRVAVVPQLPSYLSAPAALLTYGDMMNGGLHQRLGDIRSGTSHDPIGGEVFARYLGGQLRYTSNLSFQRYGYDFDQQVNALQLGGSLIALDGDNGTLRAGWAADHGTTRVTPKAVDGNSSAKYRANGVSAWITWQQGNGFWVDGILGSTRYRGDVGTDLRGADVGRVRANGWTMSVEAGMPFAVGNEWTLEPRFQLKHQALNFRNFVDGDGLAVRLGTAKQTSASLGGRITRTTNPVFMPYASLDLTHTSNGDLNADVSSEEWDIAERFGSGRVGNAYRVAAGAVSQLGDHVQVYGEGTYQHFVGSYGMRGWAGNVGIRVTF